ncbi:sphingomyelin phosphodiesterase-like [Sabethes cyaneus]|uniref:sphingomyelin phosphodiesterase-like n=1 Tax=Sabethes cyaneus TaxID=53552 RepID=UPI00237E017D|nr:sphingomyelin phosphodiesterase-like [Sabethes cyaneus]
MKLVLATFLVASVVTTVFGHENKLKSVNQIQHIPNELLEKEFHKEFLLFQRTGLKSPRLRRIINAWKFTKEDRRDLASPRDIPIEKEETFCVMCRSIVSQLIQQRQDGATRQDLFDVAYELCTMLQIQEPDICYGAIDVNIDFFIHIFDDRPNLDAGSVCGVLFENSACQINNTAFTHWAVNIDPNGRPITESKHFPGARGPNDIKILQVTDFHYDSNYRVGHNANCNRPVCCRSDLEIPDNIEDRAGRWGDYRDCDTPWDTVEEVINHMAENHPDAAYVYHTGDIIDHGVWETSVSHNIESMNRLHNKLLEVFPNKPVYNIIGNHEAHPTNVFAPTAANRPDLAMDWLYSYLADVWGNWLPRSTRNTIQQGGFYTALVRPGFRIVALNNQDCYTFNWWILWDPSHLSVQLQWLHDILLLAEQNNEKVHLLAHIPYSSSGSIFSPCQREFRRIVERFYDTVSAQFHGHTHRDEFNVFYSQENPQYAINVAWNGGSATPFSFVNPNYMVYYVDPETYQVTDFESYIFNLTDANHFQDRRPEWIRLYSFAEEFQMHNLSPAEADTMVKRLGTPAGRTELHRYWQFTVKMGDPELERGCDDNCLLNNLCDIVRVERGDDLKCDELRETFFD